MILQALVSLYDDLASQGILEKPGWSPVKVSWGLEIGNDGNLLYLLPMQVETVRGKKTILAPQLMNLPTPVKRTSGAKANFLCDKASYVLGIDSEGQTEEDPKQFLLFRKLHHDLLDDCDHPAARALLNFLDQWDLLSAAQHPVLAERIAEIGKDGNLIFVYDGVKIQDIPEIRNAWDKNFANANGATEMQCLVYGEKMPVQILHPSIKGVWGAQSSGASLVSFNSRSSESYGCEESQGLNAPVSMQAAFAYGSALNYLLSDPDHRLRIGDTTAVFWAEGGKRAYPAFLNSLIGGNDMDEGSIRDALQKVAAGLNADWNGMPLDPSNRFFILGLAPNAARLSVRFFLANTFGAMMKNIAQHQKDLEIIKPGYDRHNELSVWWLLNETVNQHSKDKQPHKQMAGDTVRAMLQGTMYPTTLFEQTQLRIRAERTVTRGRAAIIKAYLLRQPNFENKEVLTVQLNEDTRYAPYLLGRLFAVLEELQERANPGINATIRDRYFSSACATPAIVFPTLIRLAQAHLKKLNDGGRIYFDKMIGTILAAMDDGYPARLNLQDQGVFQLGYYHQVQKRYTK